MSTYAIGDLQGCAEEFNDLLQLIGFSPVRDRLWLVGDLVNRGPDSAGVLRQVMALDKDFGAVRVVLGNHDLFALIHHAGFGKSHPDDTLDSLYQAPDANALLSWLMRQALVVHEDEFLMVHAGLLPAWSATDALALAGEVAQAMAENPTEFFAAVMGNEPHRWQTGLSGVDRLRVIVNAMTRMRFCSSGGEMTLKEKRGSAFAPAGFLPWFEVPERASADTTIVCGHWSSQGLTLRPKLLALDSGCLWGGPLTAVRLEDRRVYQVPSRQVRRDFGH